MPGSMKGTALPKIMALFLSGCLFFADSPLVAQEKLRSHDCELPIYSIAFSTNGDSYAVTSERTELFDTKSGKSLFRLDQGLPSTNAMCYGQKNAVLACGGMYSDSRNAFSAIRCWNLKDGKVRLELKSESADFVSIAFSPDGKLLAGAQLGGTVRVWRMSDGKLLCKLEENSGIFRICFTRDGAKLAAASNDGSLALRDAVSLKLIKTLATNEHDYLAVSASSSKDEIFTSDLFGEIYVWDTSSGKRRKTIELEGQNGRVIPPSKVVQIAPDSGLVGAADGQCVKLWDLSTGKLIQRFEHKGRFAPKNLSIAPAGDLLLTGAEDFVDGRGQVILWKIPKTRRGD